MSEITARLPSPTTSEPNFDQRTRSFENCHRTRAMLWMVLAAGEKADVIDSHVRHIARKETILKSRRAAVQQVDGRTGGLRAIIPKDAVAKAR